MVLETDRLGAILIKSGKLNAGQLATAIEGQKRGGELLGDTCVRLGYVSAEDIARALSQQLGIPYFELGEDFRLEQEEVQLVPEQMARKYCLIPLTKKGGGVAVTLVMKDPLDIEAVETVRALTNREVHKAVSTETRIRSVIDRFYREDAHIERSLRDIVELEAAETGVVETGESDADQLRVQANDAPVVRFVNLLLMEAVRDRASDIHFEPEEKTVSVRFRVDGLLKDVTPPPRHLYPAIVTRIKILSEMDIAERRLPLDGRFKFNVSGRMIDIRVSSLPEVFGEKIVLRVLDRDSMLVNMTDIGFEGDTLERFEKVLQMPNGIVLLTGPTGSGKTTTLYSALNMLKNRTKNIQTVEDPVEYLLEGVNQMQIQPRIGLDFASALRSILRQDPDIILIGEIRDLETARIAMRASLTGHLVLSTLHTNDAPSAFSRLTDIGIEPYLIASTVRLVVSQRLVRVLCPHCKDPEQPDEDILRVSTAVFPDAQDWSYMRAVGCNKCGSLGFRGRTAIVELLPVSDPIREMILDGTKEVVFKQRAVGLGMEPLLTNGLRKVRDGITTVGEVLGVCPLTEAL